MAIKTTLVNDSSGSLETIHYFTTKPGVDSDPSVMVVAPVAGVHGTFTSQTRTGAGTSTLTTPVTGGSLILTDLLISGEKQAGSSVEVRFTDGSATETIFLISQVDVPAQVAIPFAGRFQGWRNARVDMITAGTADATVTIGYTKLPVGLVFAEWDALR